MQLHRNDALLRSRLRMSIVYFVASLVCLLGGFIVSTRIADFAALVRPGDTLQPDDLLSMQYMVSLSTLAVGMLLWWKNKAYLIRWGPKSRQDATIVHAMRGIDSRYHLFAFASPRLPDYVVAGPMGVQILLPKMISGTVACQDGRWEHADGRSALVKFLMIMSPQPSLGNPNNEARDSVEGVKRFLNQRLGDELAERIPVEAVVTLIDPNVRLTAQGCTTQALFLRNLRSHVRRAPRVLSNPDLGELVAALSSA
jgi:hypothetical protein